MDAIYMLHYHPEFAPEGNITLAQWQAQQHSRIMEPERIDISLRELEFISLTDDRAQVRFWLKYARPGYADETHKEMVLLRTDDIWQIRSEHNIRVRRL